MSQVFSGFSKSPKELSEQNNQWGLRCSSFLKWKQNRCQDALFCSGSQLGCLLWEYSCSQVSSRFVYFVLGSVNFPQPSSSNNTFFFSWAGVYFVLSPHSMGPVNNSNTKENSPPDQWKGSLRIQINTAALIQKAKGLRIERKGKQQQQ